MTLAVKKLSLTINDKTIGAAQAVCLNFFSRNASAM